MDLIPLSDGQITPLVGGGPANTAKALARLGASVNFIAGISTDSYGQMIKAEMDSSGVDLSLSLKSPLPTALAIASIDSNGLAKYEFELEGRSSFAFDSSWLPKGLPLLLHIGSVATLLEPGATALLNWARGLGVPIIFDPNIRPSIQGDRELYRRSVERWIALASVVKLSEDDLTWLYGNNESEIINSWLSKGVELVVLTRAEKGLRGYASNLTLDIPAVSLEIVDSVGAGDTIGAVIAQALAQYGCSGLISNLEQVLKRACLAASITCSRAGANPPWSYELD